MLFCFTNISAEIFLIFMLQLLNKAPYFREFFPNAVAIKSIKCFLCKSFGFESVDEIDPRSLLRKGSVVKKELSS